MRRNGKLAEDYARRHGVARWYDDVDALIGDAEVDAVYIATPPGSHAELALRVAAAGKPAYVEKPMARHGPECDRMVEAFARAELPLFVAYYRRRLPRFLKAEELVRSGVVGRITSVTYRLAEPHHRKTDHWHVDAEQSGGGHFLDVASHAIDLIDYLLGPMTQVVGTAINVDGTAAVEDSVAGNFRVRGNVPGTLTCNFSSGVRDDLMRITGTDGEIRFPVFGPAPLEVEHASAVESFDLPNPPHVAQPLIETVVDDLLGRGRCPSTGETARRTTRVMDQMLAGYYRGRDDAFWTRPQTWDGRAK